MWPSNQSGRYPAKRLRPIGGKRQLLGKLKARFPTEFEAYHEPFFGGGALFFDLRPDESTINDTNPRLINFYRQLRDNPEAVIEYLRTFRHPEEPSDPDLEFDETDRQGKEVTNFYYQQRARFNRRS